MRKCKLNSELPFGRAAFSNYVPDYESEALASLGFVLLSFRLCFHCVWFLNLAKESGKKENRGWYSCISRPHAQSLIMLDGDRMLESSGEYGNRICRYITTKQVRNFFVDAK